MPVCNVNEPRREKTGFCICENKDADQLRGDREADQRIIFAIPIVQSLYYLHPKFQVSSDLLWLYRPVCVGPGRKPRRPVFSQRGSNCFISWKQDVSLSLQEVRPIHRLCISDGMRNHPDSQY